MDYKEKIEQLTAILDQMIETFKVANDTHIYNCLNAFVVTVNMPQTSVKFI